MPLASPVAFSTRCDVFLSSAGGSDAARESFPGRLHAGLAAAGVNVYGSGESQSPLLPDEAFRRSKICIAILSKHYPSGESCLRELVQMMEGKRSKRQFVLPIFYRVEPRDLRHLRGRFKKARLSSVEGAVVGVGNIQGWPVTDGCEEEKLVKIVVQTVRRYLQLDPQKCPPIDQYNVFLNFRGADTRHGFTYRLYTELREAGVSVFKDDTDLSIGEDFGSQLLNVISGSTIYITILSPNYPSSKWCLRELKEMLECKESMGHRVFPVFVGVKPREVRYQTGEFGNALSRQGLRPGGMDATRVVRKALRDVTDSPGWDVNVLRSVERLIPKIVKETLEQLRHHFKLDVPEHLLI